MTNELVEVCGVGDCGERSIVQIEITMWNGVSLTSHTCEAHIDLAVSDLAEAVKGTRNQGIEFLERGIIKEARRLEDL